MTSIKQKDKNTWIVYADEIQLNKKGKAIQNKPYSRKDISLKTTDKRHVFHDYQEACKKFYLAELFRIQHETTKVKETHKPLPIKKIIQFYLGHQGYRVRYDLKQRTLETYIKDAERIPKEILETTIDKIRYEISEWWAREHRTAFNVMNAAFNVAVKNQYCEINPIKWINEELKNHRKAFGKRVKIKIRESKKVIPFYHKMDDLFEFLKKEGKEREYITIKLMASFAISLREVLALRFKDINKQYIEIRHCVNKSGYIEKKYDNERQIEGGEDAFELINEYRDKIGKKSEYIISNRNGHHYTVNAYMSHVLKPILTSLNMKNITAEGIRNFGIVKLLSLGLSPHHVKYFAGLQDISSIIAIEKQAPPMPIVLTKKLRSFLEETHDDYNEEEREDEMDTIRQRERSRMFEKY